MTGTLFLCLCLYVCGSKPGIEDFTPPTGWSFKAEFYANDEEHETPTALPTTTHMGFIDASVVIEGERIPVVCFTTSNLKPQPETPLDLALNPDLDLIPVQDMDSTSTAVVQILEIIPDVEPTQEDQVQGLKS